jgi:hypothetical protein
MTEGNKGRRTDDVLCFMFLLLLLLLLLLFFLYLYIYIYIYIYITIPFHFNIILSAGLNCTKTRLLERLSSRVANQLFNIQSSHS